MRTSFGVSTRTATLLWGICLFPSLVAGQFGNFNFPQGFGDIIQDAVDGLQEIFQPPAPPSPTEEALSEFSNPKYEGTLGAYEVLGKAFYELLETNRLGAAPDCPRLRNEPMPSLEGASDFTEALRDFFSLINRNSCDLSFQLAPRLFLKEKFAQPIVDFFAAIESFFPIESRRRLEAERRLQTPEDNLECVTRFEEGSLDRRLPRASDIEFFNGGTNQVRLKGSITAFYWCPICLSYSMQGNSNSFLVFYILYPI